VGFFALPNTFLKDEINSRLKLIRNIVLIYRVISTGLCYGKLSFNLNSLAKRYTIKPMNDHTAILARIIAIGKTDGDIEKPPGYAIIIIITVGKLTKLAIVSR